MSDIASDRRCSQCHERPIAMGHPRLCTPCVREVLAARIRTAASPELEAAMDLFNIRRVKAGKSALCREHLARWVEAPGAHPPRCPKA